MSIEQDATGGEGPPVADQSDAYLLDADERRVLGGLIEERSEKRDMKVPLLGDIPLLGELFRNKSETIEKTELLIVLTPHVINNNGDSIRDARMEELSKEMIDKLSLDPPLLDQIRRGELDGLQGQIGPDGERIDTIGAPSAISPVASTICAGCALFSPAR